MKYIIISFVGIISFLFSEQKSTTDIWYRNVPNPQTGEPVILELDMSYGFAIADEQTIYLIVYDRKTGQEIKMAFINGDFFTTYGSFWLDESYQTYTGQNECVGEDIKNPLTKGKPLEKK